MPHFVNNSNNYYYRTTTTTTTITITATTTATAGDIVVVVTVVAAAIITTTTTTTTTSGVRIVEWLSHSTVVQEVPGSNLGAAEKCWAIMELIVSIYLYEFVLSLACVRVRCLGLY